ncbi:MAG: MFS transporter [Candidatus Marinarcus sp.]|uniref:MFS transporter n=1 Tax=Candidatus Marinarcus sp. TaxID=3100987 RepID=UPI003B0047E7
MIKTILPLCSIISLRFLGLFLVLPVISVYAMNLKGANTTLVGVVIGGYALTQMLFQLPFGILSDKMGRKGTIIMGLLLFAIGSVICALSVDILALMVGRFLQGAGAIGAVVTAMISDLVQEEKRPKAMAFMGGSIAASFAISMLFGPIIGAYAGVASLFWITAFLALSSIYIIVKKVPNPPVITHTYTNSLKIMPILKDANLVKMNITNFLQKGLMTFAFMIIPMVLLKEFHWEIKELYKVYVPAMIFGVFAMAPAAILAEKKGKFKEVLIIGIVLFALSYLILGFSTTDIAFVIGVVLFFIGFNMHEPIMQSLASRFAKVHQRGMVLGLFNSFGYLGTFLGGLVGGIFFNSASLSDIVTAIAVVCVFWLILIFSMPNPMKKQVVYIPIDEIKRDETAKLHDNEAIDEWYINENEKLLIVKYDTNKTTQEEIVAFLK